MLKLCVYKLTRLRDTEGQGGSWSDLPASVPGSQQETGKWMQGEPMPSRVSLHYSANPIPSLTAPLITSAYASVALDSVTDSMVKVTFIEHLLCARL